MKTILCSLLFGIGVAIGVAAADGEHRPGATGAQRAPQRSELALERIRLDPAYRPILSALKQQGIRVSQRSSMCDAGEMLGVHQSGSGWVDLCVDRIRRQSFGPEGFRNLQQLTLAHEAVHVAQFCMQRRGRSASLGLPAHRLQALTAAEREQIERGIRRHRAPQERAMHWRMESEATALERHPGEVVTALATAC